MAISDTITSMYENVGNVYDVLELAGADLTNVDKNIFNLKQSWEERLLYFLANGTDVVWNNWMPKVNGTGETITLNNTIQAKMDFVYKGNTYQYSTSGKNLFNVNATHENNLSDAGITATFNSDGTITVNGTKNANYKTISYNITLPAGTYYFSGCPSGGSGGGGGYSIIVQTTNEISSQIFDTGNGATFTLTEQKKISFFPVRVGADAVTFNNAVFKPMIARVPVTYNDYEPYTGSIPAPNPDFPQDIQVVSGDNSIKVEGKNLFDKDNATILNAYVDNTTIGTSAKAKTTYIKCQPNTTYTISKDNSGNNNRFGIATTTTTPAINVSTMQYVGDNSASSLTITTNSTAEYLVIQFYHTDETKITQQQVLDSIQIEKGDTATAYEPYQSQSYAVNLGSLELCKIGDYQDSIKKSTGKNLFDYKTPNINQITWTPTDNGGLFTSSTYWKNLGNRLELDTTKQYTFSFGARNSTNLYYFIKTYTDNTYGTVKTTIVNDGTSLSKTFTPDSKYVAIYFANGGILQNVEIPNIQLEESSTKTEFEPYLPKGTWYLNKQIGKIVYTGSESGSWTPSTFGGFTRFAGPIISDTLQTARRYEMKSNYFHYLSSGGEVGAGFIYAGQFFAYPNQTITTEQDFRDWLSSHNTTVYYPLATPTTTEITDTTLISQLEAIKKSYNSQTNISQTNADKPFILDVVALGELD